MTDAILLLIIFVLILGILDLLRRIRRYKGEAIHWQQAYNNTDRWSDIALYYQRKSESGASVVMYKEAFEELSLSIWGKVDETKTVRDAIEYIRELQRKGANQ